MIYSSINNDFVKEIKKLNEKKYRDITNTFLVEGEHLVLEAIKSKLVKYVIEKGTPVMEKTAAAIKEKASIVTKDVLQRLEKKEATQENSTDVVNPEE